MQTQIVDLEPDDPRWEQVLPVLQELRTHLTRKLLDQVLAEGTPQGFRFTALFEGSECMAVAGWRVIANTSAIRKLYIDDLCTAPQARSRGHGTALLDELVTRAQELGCTVIDLDSGVQRYEAHRFYFREHMHIRSYHFARQLG